MSTGDWPLASPQTGNPMVLQCSGPIGDAGSWFHGAAAAAWAGPASKDGTGPPSVAAPVAAAVAPAVLNRSRRVSSAMSPSLCPACGSAPRQGHRPLTGIAYFL